MDAGTHRGLTIIISSVAALGGLVAILGYFDRKRDIALKREVLEIEKNIKLLDLDNKLHHSMVKA